MCVCVCVCVCVLCACRAGNRSKADIPKLGVRILAARDLCDGDARIDAFLRVKCEHQCFATSTPARVSSAQASAHAITTKNRALLPVRAWMLCTIPRCAYMCVSHVASQPCLVLPVHACVCVCVPCGLLTLGFSVCVHVHVCVCVFMQTSDPVFDEFFTFEVCEPSVAVLRIKLYQRQTCCWRPLRVGEVRPRERHIHAHATPCIHARHTCMPCPLPPYPTPHPRDPTNAENAFSMHACMQTIVWLSSLYNYYALLVVSQVRVPVSSINENAAEYGQPTWHTLRKRSGALCKAQVRVAGKTQASHEQAGPHVEEGKRVMLVTCMLVQCDLQVQLQVHYMTVRVHRPLNVLCCTWNVGNAVRD